MIALDTNLLIYAHLEESPWNARAYQLIGDLAASGTAWAIPLQCLTEFFGIVTHPKIYKHPSTAMEAVAQIDAWLAAPTVSVIGEDSTTWHHLRQLAVAAKLTGPRIHDARIAAVCLQHGVTELWSNDRDFSRFPALRVRNPLVAPYPTRASEGQATYRVERRGRRPASTTSARVR